MSRLAISSSGANSGNSLIMLAQRVRIGEEQVYKPGDRDPDDPNKDYDYYAYDNWSFTVSHQIQYYQDVEKVSGVIISDSISSLPSVSISFNGSGDVKVSAPDNWLISQDFIQPLDHPKGRLSRRQIVGYDIGKQYYMSLDSVDIPGGDMDETAEESCGFEFTSINANFQTKNFNGVPYARNVINVTLSRKHYDVTKIEGLDSLLYRAPHLYGTLAGSNQFQIEPPTDYPNFCMTAQVYTPMEVAGSKFIQETRNYWTCGKWSKLSDF